MLKEPVDDKKVAVLIVRGISFSFGFESNI